MSNKRVKDKNEQCSYIRTKKSGKAITQSSNPLPPIKSDWKNVASVVIKNNRGAWEKLAEE